MSTSKRFGDSGMLVILKSILLQGSIVNSCTYTLPLLQ